MVSVTFLKVCCQSDVSFSCRRNALQFNELSPSTKYVLPRIHREYFIESAGVRYLRTSC